MKPRVSEGEAIGRLQRPVRYQWIQPGSTKSSGVCFVCPGAGYSVERPLLYYSTMLLLDRGIDVVHVQYEYRNESSFWEKSLEEKSDWMTEDVQSVVNQVMSENAYENVWFLGKSVGTMPIANGLCQDPRYTAAKAVLLTPLISNERLANSILACPQEMLIVMGTEDHFYHEQNLEEIRSRRGNIRLCLIEKANHSLEIGADVPAALAIMQQIFAEMEDLLGRDYHCQLE